MSRRRTAKAGARCAPESITLYLSWADGCGGVEDEVTVRSPVTLAPTRAELEEAAHAAREALERALGRRFSAPAGRRAEHEWVPTPGRSDLTGHCACGWRRQSPSLRRAWNMHKRQKERKP